MTTDTKVRLWSYFMGLMLGLSLGTRITTHYWVGKFEELNRRAEAVRVYAETNCGKIKGTNAKSMYRGWPQTKPPRLLE